MFERHYINTIYEWDIDLLLLEEFIASPKFRDWIVDLIFQDNQNAGELVGIWHSVSDFYGEADIIYLEENENGRRAILIENKIKASPQPDQAERYRQRGRAGVDDGDWYDFRTCLIAPLKYIQGVSNSDRYDSQISYEQIRDFLMSTSGNRARNEHKTIMLNVAIEKGQSSQSDPDPQVTEFFRDYYFYVKENFSQLFMNEPYPRPAGSGWAYFPVHQLEKPAELIHKLPEGTVDLSFVALGHQKKELRRLNQHLFDEDMRVEGTLITAYIRIRVPKIIPSRPFAEQQDEVDVALQAVVRLLELLPRIQLPDLAGET